MSTLATRATRKRQVVSPPVFAILFLPHGLERAVKLAEESLEDQGWVINACRDALLELPIDQQRRGKIRKVLATKLADSDYAAATFADVPEWKWDRENPQFFPDYLAAEIFGWEEKRRSVMAR